MKEIILTTGIIICFISCNNWTKQKSVEDQENYVFFDSFLLPDGEKTEYPLDIIVHRSHIENKPILLWISAYIYSFDNILIQEINANHLLKDYLLDSMVVCRLMVDSKVKVRNIEKPEMKSLLPESKIFKYEGHIAQWISDNYCDSLLGVMVVTDYKLKRYSPYVPSNAFLNDKRAFIDFLKKAKMTYDSLNHQ